MSPSQSIEKTGFSLCMHFSCHTYMRWNQQTQVYIKKRLTIQIRFFYAASDRQIESFGIDEVSGPGQLYFIFTAITYSAGLCAQPYKCPTTKQIRIRFDCHFKRCDPIKMGEITWWEFVADCAWPNYPGALCLVRHHCNNRNRVSKCSSVVTMEIHKAFQCQLV